ncbi:MAG: hypothetical protein JW871_02310 [Endomicrobiales bacterium]|nr:hypothetical protein [Endomicrobiales bacterium]
MNLLFIKTIGGSMRPTIKSEQFVCVEKVSPDDIKEGDMILYRADGKQFIHRVEKKENGVFRIVDDAGTIGMEQILQEEIIGRVISVFNGRFGLIYQRFLSFLFKVARCLKYKIIKQ